MVRESVHGLFRSALSRLPSSPPEDQAAFFWVDWREDDDQVPGLCEAVLCTGQLAADWEGEQLVIVWRNRRVPVPLKKSIAATLGASPVFGSIAAALPSPISDILPWLTRENRHITLVVLNQILQPDYEIRRVRESGDPDCAAYLPLPAEDWATLEKQYGRDAIDATVEPIMVEATASAPQNSGGSPEIGCA